MSDATASTGLLCSRAGPGGVKGRFPLHPLARLVDRPCRCRVRVTVRQASMFKLVGLRLDITRVPCVVHSSHPGRPEWQERMRKFRMFESPGGIARLCRTGARSTRTQESSTSIWSL